MARDYSQVVSVRGLREFRAALKDASDRLPRELGRAHRDVARFVVEMATQRAMQTSREAARGARGLAWSGGQLTSTVRLSGDKVPGALGSEFGAAHNIPRQTSRGVVRGWNQFETWRGNKADAGLWLFPTIRSTQAEQLALYERMVELLMKTAYPD